MKVNNLILGAGIAGLGAGLKLEELGEEYLILEKNDSYGGLCGNFVINGFRFDRFIHLSFTTIEFVKNIFEKTSLHKHNPVMENYWNSYWVKHPAQNNLYPLPQDVKDKVLSDMLMRKNAGNVESINDYEEWLRYQFGDFFAENFPMVYTRKYWGVEAKELETKWIGNRIYQPSIEEVRKGMETWDTGNTYYAKEMRYPMQGGYKTFLKAIANEEKILCNEEVIEVDSKNKKVYTNENVYEYDRLFSSIPLPEYNRLLKLPSDVEKSLNNLSWTSGYLVSLGFKGELPKKETLWNYIYDEDILPARIYYPGRKSKDNCPDGCSSIQAEIYFKNTNIPDVEPSEILRRTVEKLEQAGIIKKDGMLFADIRFEKYANVIFEHKIYENRKKVISYLKENGITPIGRFGEWDYLWSDQSLMSGYGIE